MNKYLGFQFKRISNKVNFRRFNYFSAIPIKNQIPMKRIFSLVALLALAGVLTTSCGTQKKACAAYSSVEQHNPADNG